MQGWKDTLDEYREIKKTLDTYKGILEGFAPVVQAAQELIDSALTQVKGMYDNVDNIDGNLTFNTDFKLDLSPYTDIIDTDLNYKEILEDYHTRINSTDNTNPENNPEDSEVGDNDNPPYNPPYNPPNQDGSSRTTEPQGGGVTTEPQTSAPEKSTASPYKGDDDVYVDVPTEPIIEIPYGDEDEIIDYPILPDKDGYVNLPFGPYFNEEEEPQIVNIDSTVVEDVPGIDINSPYYEQPVERPKITNLVHSTLEEQAPARAESSIKTMGVATGAGIALGAAALAAHSAIVQKDDEDEEEKDYGYKK